MAGSEDFKLDPITFNPYKALDLSEDATPAQIKMAYRRLVLTTHPDKIQDEAERQRRDGEFHNVQTAFDILRNEDRRRQWDERVKLANAWKAAREHPTTPRRAQTQDYTPARPRYTPTRYETYDGRMYEERVPKSSSRAYEDDFFSARFAEPRPSPKKFDDRYADYPSRKTSGRAPDDRDRRASKESEVSRAKKDEAYQREQSKKKRDIEKKRDHAESFQKKSTVKDDYSSESDLDRYCSSKSESRSKRGDYDRRKVREVPIRSNKAFPYEDDDDELKPKVRGVKDYINKSREPPRRRADTYEERPAPPPSPPYSQYDIGRRSSGDDGRRTSGKTHSRQEISPPRKSTKEKRLRDMVDPPSSPRTRMPASSSDPRPLREMVTPSKSRGEPRRAATFEPESEFVKPSLTRAATTPSKASMRREPTSSGSHLKRSTRPPPSDSESSDASDSHSDATPIMEPPAPKSRKNPLRPALSTKQYKVVNEESRSPRTYRDDEEVHSSRDSSPRNPRRSSEQPPVPIRPAPSTRTQSVRSQYIPAESPVPSSRQPYTRTTSSRKAPPTHTSSRTSKPLFGAVDERDYLPKSAHHSPKTSYPSPREESFGRRGSADKPFDDYPGSHSKSHRRPQRPAVH